eukprot:Hpha_TRINITY_DN30478_c0_g1::TRINITY_DN30478_c0_g1_i1::g.168060::m.168060
MRSGSATSFDISLASPSPDDPWPQSPGRSPRRRHGIEGDLQLRYEALQAELRAKFERARGEYGALERQLREANARRDASYTERESSLKAREMELRNTHSKLEQQVDLIRQQASELEARERACEAREARAAAAEAAAVRAAAGEGRSDLEARVKQLGEVAALQAERAEKAREEERALAQRAAELDEKLQRLEKLEEQLGEKSSQLDARDKARSSELDAREKAAEDAERRLTGLETGLERLRKAQCKDAAAETEPLETPCHLPAELKDRPVEEQERHATALWLAAQRKEAILQAWESGLNARETAAAEAQQAAVEAQADAEKQAAEAEFRHQQSLALQQTVQEGAEALLTAAELAERRAGDHLSERLASRCGLDRAAVAANLVAWEQELEELRSVLHSRAAAARLALTSQGVTESSGAAAIELAARELAVRDREVRWFDFLSEACQDNSGLVAFKVEERLRSAESAEHAVAAREAGLEAERERMTARVQEAEKSSEEAASLLRRLGELHKVRSEVEQLKNETDQRCEELTRKEAIMSTEYGLLKRRWDELHGKERQMEERLAAEREAQERSVQGRTGLRARVTKELAGAGTPCVSLAQSVFGITKMLDHYAAIALQDPPLKRLVDENEYATISKVCERRCPASPEPDPSPSK